MQTGRLFEIVYILMDKKTVKADELARHFEVSKRTILRDIDRLSAAGIPVYASPGRGGGISIMDDYVLNKTALSDDEMEYILMSLQNMTATGNTDEKSMGRLKSFFGKEDTDWIEVDFSRWGSRKTDTEKFDLLKDAILKSNTIEFKYIDPYGRESDRNVYPLKLAFKAKSWYLQGFDRNKDDYRTFKINRISEINIIHDVFDRKGFVLPPIESEFGGQTKEVELIFSPEMAFRVYDEFDENAIDRDDNANMRVMVRIPEDDWLYSYLMSFGKSVTVVQPREVAKTLKKKHEEALND